MDIPSNTTSRQRAQAGSCDCPSEGRIAELAEVLGLTRAELAAETSWRFCVGCELNHRGGHVPAIGVKDDGECRFCGFVAEEGTDG